MATQNRTDGCPQPMAIGIDLGTSKCCVAAVRDGRAHVLENEFGQRTTPSWVAFNSQQRLVGGAALDQAVVNCANTVSAVKRNLGRTYDDVKGLPSTCKIKKCYTDVNFQYCVNYRKRQQQLSPEQITAMMLTKMVDIAENSLGRPVGKAVISVPACYGNAQRAAIINAAKVAGLEVLQLINETTAAGIAFEDNRSVKTPVTIAVVDFGAGKLDISVMEVEEKSIKVIGASGSPYLGGCTIDELLVNYCVEIIQQKYGTEVKISDKARGKLRLACEKAKKTLSLLPEAQVSIESLFEDCDVQIPLHRQNICDLIEDAIQKTIIGNFERIFKEKSMRKHSIDKVVLVGGSTRIPVVRSTLEEYFESHKLDQTVNQDEAVAQGAALQAAALSGAAAGIEVSDVSSFDVYFSGSCQCINKFDKMINKFSPFLSSRSHKFNEARGTKIRFFERMNRFDGSKCDTDLLSVEFTGSFASSDGFVNAELTLHLNESGIFSVSIPPPNDKSRLKLKPSTSHNSYEINNWVKEESKFRCDAKTEMKRVDAEVELESLCYDVQSVLDELELMEYISHDELETSKKAVSDAKKWMTNNIETAPLYEIQHKINKVNNTKKDVHRMMNTARKKAIEKEEAAKKQVEIELLNKQIFAIESDLSGLISALEDSDFMWDCCPIINKCKAVVSSLITWKKDIESASLTELSQKLEELTRVKREVDQLKADAAREKARLEEEKATRGKAEMEFFKVQMSDFLSLLSEINYMLDDTNLAIYSDSRLFCSCESELQSLVVWKENTLTASAAQVSQKLKELTELKDKVHQLKENAVEKARLEEEKAARKRAEVELFNVDQNGEPCSSFRSRQSSEYNDVGHRSRTPHNSKEKEEKQKVPNRERSSSRSRHGSANSKEQERRPVGLGSTSAVERHHQPKAPCEGTANGGFHLHQRGSSDRCTEQPTSARGPGSTLDQMRKSAVENHVTLPTKHSPRLCLAPSEGCNLSITCQSKETQTASTTTSARTQTDVALLGKSREDGNDTSTSDEFKELSIEEVDKIRKFKNLDILLPLLQTVDNTMSNMVNCELCTSIRLPCSHHRSEGLQELGRMLNIIPEILSQKLPAKTGVVNFNVQTATALEPADNFGASQRYTASNYSCKDYGLSNGSVDAVQGPTAVSHQSIAVGSDTHSSLDRSFLTPQGLAGVTMSYSPVYPQSSRSPVMKTRSCNYAAGPYHRNQHTGKITNSYVRKMKQHYEELNKKQ